MSQGPWDDGSPYAGPPQGRPPVFPPQQQPRDSAPPYPPFPAGAYPPHSPPPYPPFGHGRQRMQAPPRRGLWLALAVACAAFLVLTAAAVAGRSSGPVPHGAHPGLSFLLQLAALGCVLTGALAVAVRTRASYRALQAAVVAAAAAIVATWAGLYFG